MQFSENENEKINEIERTRVRSPPRTPGNLLKKTHLSNWAKIGRIWSPCLALDAAAVK
jgi:hypothetical protein